jgi:hypothetical protein
MRREIGQSAQYHEKILRSEKVADNAWQRALGSSPRLIVR